MKKVLSWIGVIIVALMLFFAGLWVFTVCTNFVLLAVGLNSLTMWDSCSLLFVALLLKWFLK